MRIRRMHAIELSLDINTAFQLFTPLGEIDWVEGWQPEFIHPTDGKTEIGMVFRTGTDAEETLWSCILWSPEMHHVRYARVTPASRFVEVDVRCEACAPAETRVHVRYDMTALTLAGEAILSGITPETFSASIEDWRDKIERRIIAHA